MSCDVGKAREGLEMSCDVAEATESLENEQRSFSKLSVTSPTSQLILQSFLRFTYVTAHSPSRAHSPNFQSLHLRHSSFFNSSLALPTSQLILQPFRCFTYVTTRSPTLLCFSYVIGFSLTSPGEPPMRRFTARKRISSLNESVCAKFVGIFTLTRKRSY